MLFGVTDGDQDYLAMLTIRWYEAILGNITILG